MTPLLDSVLHVELQDFCHKFLADGVSQASPHFMACLENCTADSLLSKQAMYGSLIVLSIDAHGGSELSCQASTYVCKICGADTTY